MNEDLCWTHPRKQRVFQARRMMNYHYTRAAEVTILAVVAVGALFVELAKAAKYTMEWIWE